MTRSKIVLYALHGFLGKPSDWKDLFQKSDLQTIHAVDIFNAFSLDSLTDWIEGFNQSIERKRAGSLRVLMGYSLGGRLALHALFQNPTLWDAAIIISAHPGLSSDNEKHQRLSIDEEWACRFENEPWDELMQAWNSRDVFSGDGFKPNLLPMNGSDSNSFPLEARKNKGTILRNMTPLFSEPRVRASRERIISNPTAFIGSKLGFKFQRKEEDYSRIALAKVLRNFSLGRQNDFTHLLMNLNKPIFWMAGENDQRYAAQTARISLKHPLSKIWIAPQSGHRLPWQIPELFLTQSMQFLSTTCVNYPEYTNDNCP